MDRAYTRYRRAVALVRKRNIAYRHSCGNGWEFLTEPRWNGRLIRWQSDSYRWMNEPGWWVHEFMTVPARRREQYLIRGVEIGKLDPEGIVWPDNRKPHQYFW